jgi:hypothetical protein
MYNVRLLEIGTMNPTIQQIYTNKNENIKHPKKDALISYFHYSILTITLKGPDTIE